MVVDHPMGSPQWEAAKERLRLREADGAAQAGQKRQRDSAGGAHGSKAATQATKAHE